MSSGGNGRDTRRSEIDQLEVDLRQKQGELDHATRTLAEEEERLVREKARLADVEEALSILQNLATTIQNKVHGQIASIVSRCLAAVFDDPYEFRIHFSRTRGRSAATMVLVGLDGVEIDPLTATGGGVVDVVSFALRLASLLLTKPARRRLLIMDEPFRFVSKEYRGRIVALLETLAHELQVQFLIVTHMDELAGANVTKVQLTKPPRRSPQSPPPSAAPTSRKRSRS